MLVKVLDSIDDKEDHNFLETLLVAHPLLGMEVPIGEVIKDGQVCQRSSTPKDCHSQQVECDLFSDTREFVSLPEVEGQSYFHCLICYSRKQWSWRRLRYKARRGRRGWVFSQGGCRNLKWSWRSRSVCLGILFILPMQSSCTKRKIKIVSDVVALTISWGIVQKTSVRLPGKQVKRLKGGQQRREVGTLKSQ